jgi:hypothetical protein
MRACVRACVVVHNQIGNKKTYLSYPQVYLGKYQLIDNGNGDIPDTDSLCVTESMGARGHKILVLGS